MEGLWKNGRRLIYGKVPATLEYPVVSMSSFIVVPDEYGMKKVKAWRIKDWIWEG